MQPSLAAPHPAPITSSTRGPPRLLVVDDEPDACEALRVLLETEGYWVTTATTASRALAGVVSESYDLLLVDVAMPGTDGITLCREVAEVRPTLPVVLVTAHSDPATLTRALRAGARDFLTKPLEVDALLSTLGRLLGRQSARLAPSRGRVVEGTGRPFELGLACLVGESDGMLKVRKLIVDLSGSLASVLIQGETGTGKEIIAHALHLTSRLSAGPFIALNCAAIPAGLLESELFGHARGAFTDARSAKKGLLAQADGGTLLLDEVTELPLPMQPKLLRALQERTVRPLGGHQEIPFNCRLITAANQDLDREIEAKRFREDLFYRLDVVRIAVPPLRARGADILLLALHFLERFSGGPRGVASLSEAAAAKLLTYTWPGNVRELENCVARAVALSGSAELTVADLPERIQRFEVAEHLPPGSRPHEVVPIDSLFDAEMRHVLRAVEFFGGDKTRAATALRIDRRTLYRRLERYEAMKTRRRSAD
jgi:DNA-binding NtrC family response regulator